MWAQEGINYQAAVRDGSGVLMTNQSVAAEFQIISGTAGGTVVYEETHNVTTNDYGLMNVVIGTGTVVSGVFANIDWGAEAHFLGITIDGNNLGTVQFQSVPYAKNAETLTNVRPNTLTGDVEVSSTDTEATLSIVPRQNTLEDDSRVFFGEGTNSTYGMYLTYDGVDNDLSITGLNSGVETGAHLTIDRDSGVSTFERGVVVEETTETPAPKTTYGNSGPLAYGYFLGGSGSIVTDYGISSISSSSTGVYEVVLDNNWQGSPVVVVSSFNATSAVENAVYNTTGSNTVIVRIVDENDTPVSSNFSMVVYGTPQ